MSNILQKDRSARPFNLKTYTEILEEGLQYIEDRRSGKIKSFKMPWGGLNSFGVGGLEWGSMMTIGARPGAGKTMFVSQILREARINNPTQNFNILEFQFEMGPKQTAARDFVSQIGLDYNKILSTQQQLDEFSAGLIKKYVEESKSLQQSGVYRVQINDSITSREMEKAIITTYDGLGSKPLIVTIDHSWLIKKDRDEREKLNTLYNTVEMLMQLKNKLPIIILMVTQLNRSIDEPLRKMPGTIGNYPTSSDIFGGDALMQGSDMVLVLNRPFKSDILLYGPKEYNSKAEHIFAHIIKSRNASDDNNIIFMEADFSKQKVFEIPDIPCNNATGAPFRRRSGNRNSDTGPQVE